MYQSYFGLKEHAFSIAVDPRYLYMSRQHQEALAHLLYGVHGGGFVLLSGEVGTGKTTIIRRLLEKLPENTNIAIILNPMASVIELLETICDELGIATPKSPTVKSLTDAVYKFLLANHSKSRNTVLLIDEAQLLSPEVLEQLRLLTNLETSAKKLLQIILVGQPELNALLAQPRLRQLSQRITARFHLKPLTVKETRAYIRHRLKIAGMPEERDPFTERVVRRIHSFTGGIPRRINVLCERMLIGAYGHNKPRIDSQIFKLAQGEVEGNFNRQQKKPIAIWLAASAIALTCIIFTVIFTAKAIKPSANTSVDSTSSEHFPITRSVKRVPASTPDAPSSEQTDTMFGSAFYAQSQLFNYLGIKSSFEQNPCWTSNSNHACTKEKIIDWGELKRINRPAVLTLVTPDKFRGYSIVIGIEEKYALVLSADEEILTPQKIRLTELGPAWTGEVFYVWHRPKGFNEPLIIGQRGPAVAWVARQFAKLDGRETPLTNALFNRALEKRTKIFQKEHGLKEDGIIGTSTLLKLNEEIGLDATLKTVF